MRTTVQIDDDLLRDLRERAHREGTSLAKLVNRALRHGISALAQAGKPKRPYRQKTFSMGQPKVNLDKALALAASLEDEEVCEELAQRK
jgi:hypothetical protein